MKERDSKGRFVEGHTPLFSDGSKDRKPPQMTYHDYVKTLQEMLKKKEGKE